MPILVERACLKGVLARRQGFQARSDAGATARASAATLPPRYTVISEYDAARRGGRVAIGNHWSIARRGITGTEPSLAYESEKTRGTEADPLPARESEPPDAA